MRQEVLGTILAAAGLAAFGAILIARRRRRRGAERLRGRLALTQVLPSPDGRLAAAVLVGPASDDRVEGAIETGLWWLLWLFPGRLVRLEVWILPAAPGAPLAPERLLAAEPVARRVVWRGPGGHADGRRVTLRWTGPRSVEAVCAGVTFALEAPPDQNVPS